jgi:hypothetical protein
VLPEQLTTLVGKATLPFRASFDDVESCFWSDCHQ